jgi:hypothetical protein
MSLKTENSRRVAKSRPVCMGHKSAFTMKNSENYLLHEFAFNLLGPIL